ncbi:MAG: carboxynorspermidine decarboxylase [Eubacteriales bacterium]|nr:carboxynorspermidine decarboxylase [Eubacteriales bacterium]
MSKQLIHPSQLRSQAQPTAPEDLPFDLVKTPAYLIDCRLLEEHLKFFEAMRQSLDIKILLAQKSYSLYATYPLIGRYLNGTTASGLHEARLAYEEMPGSEVHCFSAAFKDDELRELYQVCDTLVFNSYSQLKRYRELLPELHGSRAPRIGLRLNPQISTASHEIYDPAAPGSRLGLTRAHVDELLADSGLKDSSGDSRGDVSGFLIHALCEQGAEDFQTLLAGSLDRFDDLFREASWLNFGGGHHFTKRNYNLELFAKLCGELHDRYPQTEIYVEPGEAISLDCGWLVCELLDLVDNQLQIAICDTSAVCHMPDVLEMPYRPRCFLAEAPFKLAEETGEHLYRLTGPTCLAGDRIGDYAFQRPLQIGDRLIFADMAIYTHVKTNQFNGMPLPSLYSFDDSGLHLIRHFDYQDFKNLLG